jgi:hypothetical protein
VTGILSDTYGPRIPIAIGSALHVFGIMMASISHEYYQFFLTQSVASAIGCSFLFFPSTLLICCKPTCNPPKSSGTMLIQDHSTSNSRPILRQTSCSRPRHCRRRLLYRRRRPAHHGRAPHASSRLWLGYAQCRIPVPRSSCHWQYMRQGSSPASKARIQVQGVPCPILRSSIRPAHGREFLHLLGWIPAVHVCYCASEGRGHEYTTGDVFGVSSEWSFVCPRAHYVRNAY